MVACSKEDKQHLFMKFILRKNTGGQIVWELYSNIPQIHNQSSEVSKLIMIFLKKSEVFVYQQDTRLNAEAAKQAVDNQ